MQRIDALPRGEMADFWTTVGSADFARIVALSLGVSLSATGIAILLGFTVVSMFFWGRAAV